MLEAFDVWAEGGTARYEQLRYSPGESFLTLSVRVRGKDVSATAVVGVRIDPSAIARAAEDASLGPARPAFPPAPLRKNATIF